jgi:hypothetical protein
MNIPSKTILNLDPENTSSLAIIEEMNDAICDKGQKVNNATQRAYLKRKMLIGSTLAEKIVMFQLHRILKINSDWYHSAY